jgi:hypothetical protein
MAMTLAAPAMAMSTIEIRSLSATWSDAVAAGAGNLFLGFTGNGTNDATVNWGGQVDGGPQSGYRFESELLPISEAFSAIGSADFKIGEFTHINNPVFAPSIASVVLTLSYNVWLDNVQIGTFNSVYDFTHTETVNAPENGQCPFGGANFQGINDNGCSDRVQIGLNKGLSQRFDVNGVSYQFEIGGFSDGHGGVLNEFITREAANNVADLVGNISVVPEPASWAMLIAGFGLVGATMRRRRQQGTHVLA